MPPRTITPMQGPLGFLLFWVVALSAGCALVLLALGGSFGWLVLVALPALGLLLVAVAGRRRRR
jgi:hypothetical protein